MIDYPGREERLLAEDLIQRLDPEVRTGLSLTGIDLEPAAVHVIYTALRGGSPADDRRGAAATMMRSAGRLVHSLTTRQQDALRPPGGVGGLVILTTHPTHAEVWAPVGEEVTNQSGMRATVVDAGSTSRRRPGSASRIKLADQPVDHARAALWRHLVRTTSAFRYAPAAWRVSLGSSRADWLRDVVRASLPILAMDAARLSGFLHRTQPRAVVCFSESGLMARLAPSAAHAHGIPIVDLPHAEAADPWGTRGAAYDRVAVYGPRAADVMRQAGFDADQVSIVGPLRYDRLIHSMATAVPGVQDLRRIVFAAQPANERKPAQHPNLKEQALRTTIEAAATAAPCEIIIVPHPTETDTVTNRVMQDAATPPGVTARIESVHGLHDVLLDAWALVTVFSQSIFEAAVAGIPAVSFAPLGSAVPTSFIDEGIAQGAGSTREMEARFRAFMDPATRQRIVASARSALQARLGALDGRAASRAARVVIDAVVAPETPYEASRRRMSAP